LQRIGPLRFEANYGTWSTPKDGTDDTRKDIHRKHDSGGPPVLPDVLFVHSDLLAFEGRVLIAPGELDKYEVDDC
jgi:hypothetical protein